MGLAVCGRGGRMMTNLWEETLKELASNIPNGWILKTARIKGKFFPDEDAPTYYNTFPWNNEKDPKKAFKSYCKQ